MTDIHAQGRSHGEEEAAAPSSDDGKRPGLTTEEKDELTKLRRENRRLREDVEILKRAGNSFLREGDPVKMDPFIEAERAAGRSVKRCCELFEVSRAAYNERRNGQPCARAISDAELTGKIREIHEESKGTCGSPRVHKELNKRGVACGRRRVGRLMRLAGLEGRAKKRWRKTTTPDPDFDREELREGWQASDRDSRSVRPDGLVPSGGRVGGVFVPADPESKGGSEATVKIAKDDFVPTDTNLRDDYRSWAELVEACEVLAKVNGREHRITRRRPDEMLAEEQRRLHRLPDVAYTAAFGETRKVSWSTTISFGGVTYSVPHTLVDDAVWVRAHYPPRPDGPLARQPKATNAAETEFLAIAEGARSWLVEAAAAGTSRVKVKMAEAVTLSRLHGTGRVD